jgi:hypothetical protein
MLVSHLDELHPLIQPRAFGVIGWSSIAWIEPCIQTRLARLATHINILFG